MVIYTTGIEYKLVRGNLFQDESAAAVPDLTPQNLQATNADRQIQLTWDADANLEYLIYVNTVDDFNTATFMSSVAAASTSIAYNSTDNLDPVPFAGTLTTGSKYFFWAVGGDGASNPVTDPSNSAAGRAFVILDSAESTNLYVPDGATMDLIDLLFRSSPTLPDGLVINDGNGWETFGGEWLDSDDFSQADNHPVTGSFTITNLTGSSFTFWDTEP